MSRRYIRLTIQMIGEVPTADMRFIDRLKKGVAFNMYESPLDAGEVDVKVEIFGEVEVNDHGYTKPWVGDKK